MSVFSNKSAKTILSAQVIVSVLLATFATALVAGGIAASTGTASAQGAIRSAADLPATTLQAHGHLDRASHCTLA